MDRLGDTATTLQRLSLRETRRIRLTLQWHVPDSTIEKTALLEPLDELHRVSPTRHLFEERLKRFARLAYHAKRVLERVAEVVELLDDRLHGKCVREEEQMPGALDFSVPDDVEVANRVHLRMTYLALE